MSTNCVTELDSTLSEDSDSQTSPCDPAALAAMTAERDQLAAEKAELQDRFLRSQAEFQNLRKRVEKERVELHEYASTEAVRALLPILDDFERALKAEHADKEYAKGMELIYQRLFDSLKKLGWSRLYPRDSPSIRTCITPWKWWRPRKPPDDTVLDEYQRGYNFKGRLLRPAMVKVAVAAGSPED